MSFPRYAAYKDSGVEWLGEVPQGWEVKRLLRVFQSYFGARHPQMNNETFILRWRFHLGYC